MNVLDNVETTGSRPVPVTIWRRVFRLTLVYYSDLLEAHLGGLMLVFGAWLSLPFDAFADAPSLAHMSRLAPEAAWGAAMGVLGLAQQIGTLFEIRLLRRIASLTAVAVWILIAVEIGRVTPTSVWCPVIGFLAGGSALCYIRLSLARRFR